jgi:probable HAF family extracellular repeat protein
MRTTRSLFIAAVFIALLAPAGRVTAQRPLIPLIIDLGTLGGDESAAHGINNRGDIVGFSRVGVGQSAPVHAFLWTAKGGMQDLGVPADAVNSVAYDVNEHRDVVGSYLTLTPEPHERAFLWSPGSGFTDLGPGIAHSINDRGQIVGACTVAPEAVHACLIEDGVVVDLGTLGGSSSTANAINERGVVVGESRTVEGSIKAFLWTERTGMLDLVPGEPESIAHDINQAGVVAIDSPTGALLLIGDELMSLPLPDGSRGTVLAVNEARLAVGGFSIDGGPLRGFAARRGEAVDLGTLGGAESIALAVNSRGMIAGRAQTGSTQLRAVLWRLVN